MTRQYPVVYEWAGRNFSGYAPDVPGCAATAKTLPGMRSALKGALEAHLEWMANDGDAIPSASESVTVEMEHDPESPLPRGYYVIVEKLAISLPGARSSSRRTSQSKRPVTKRRAAAAA